MGGFLLFFCLGAWRLGALEREAKRMRGERGRQTAALAICACDCVLCGGNGGGKELWEQVQGSLEKALVSPNWVKYTYGVGGEAAKKKKEAKRITSHHHLLSLHSPLAPDNNNNNNKYLIHTHTPQASSPNFAVFICTALGSCSVCSQVIPLLVVLSSSSPACCCLSP